MVQELEKQAREDKAAAHAARTADARRERQKAAERYEDAEWIKVSEQEQLEQQQAEEQLAAQQAAAQVCHPF
jgi:hypothetical protein